MLIMLVCCLSGQNMCCVCRSSGFFITGMTQKIGIKRNQGLESWGRTVFYSLAHIPIGLYYNFYQGKNLPLYDTLFSMWDVNLKDNKKKYFANVQRYKPAQFLTILNFHFLSNVFAWLFSRRFDNPASNLEIWVY